MLFLIRAFPYGESTITTTFFVLFAGASIVAQVTAVYFLIRSLQGYWYEQIPSSDKLQAYFHELQRFRENRGASPEQAQKDFDEYMQERLAEATATNRANNTKTAGALHYTVKCIVFALVFSALSFVPYFAQTFAGGPEHSPASAAPLGGANDQR